MDYIIIGITVLFGAGMTFFSGFGLGTLLLPVFSVFFDLPVAIGATAIVHFANNIFKFAMVSRYIHLQTLLRFGIPAIGFAALGGWLLTRIDNQQVLASYELLEKSFNVTLVGIVIGLLMIFFAWFDLDPRFDKLQAKPKHLPFGGALSGFFGGLSGHQGAFRATFLTKAGLTKEQFIGTSNAVSLLVDIVRITIYLLPLATGGIGLKAALWDGQHLLIVGIVCAFLGTFLGKRLIHKTTIEGIRRLVGVLLILMGLLLGTGIL